MGVLDDRASRIAAGCGAAGLVLLLGAALVAWQSSKPPPRRVYEGRVVEKRFDPAHEHHYLQQIYAGQTCVKSGSSNVCTPNYIFVPQTDHVPDRWFITVRGCPRRAKEAPVEFCQKMRTRTIGVDGITFHDMAIGAAWQSSTRPAS